jgi:hypothetical protein
MRTSTRILSILSVLSLSLTVTGYSEPVHPDRLPASQEAKTVAQPEPQELDAQLKGQARIISAKRATPLSVSASGRIMITSSSADIKFELNADLSKTQSALSWLRPEC